MPSITDSLTELGIGWTAISIVEASEAVRICSTCADTAGRAMQTVSAYFVIASLRRNDTAIASATDREIAASVPKLRGAGCVGVDAYRKQVKPLLVAWGLVTCTQPKQTGNGRKPTTYGFPMLEKLMKGIQPTGQLTNGLSDRGS